MLSSVLLIAFTKMCLPRWCEWFDPTSASPTWVLSLEALTLWGWKTIDKKVWQKLEQNAATFCSSVWTVSLLCVRIFLVQFFCPDWSEQIVERFVDILARLGRRLDIRHVPRVGLETFLDLFNQCDQIWRNFTSIWHIFKGLFVTWQNAEPTLAILWHYWTNFHCCK